MPGEIIEAVWSPQSAAVILKLGGSVYGTYTVRRIVTGHPTELVRGATGLVIPDGLVMSDLEAPLDSVVTYQATVTNTNPPTVSEVTVATPLPHGLRRVWLKAPGNPELTVTASLVNVSDVQTSMIGQVYNVPGRNAIVSSVGITPETMSLTIRATDDSTWAGLKRLYGTTQTWLVQCGRGAPFESGWWAVTAMAASMVVQQWDFPERNVTLTCQRAERPGGSSPPMIPGVSWNTLKGQNGTWDDVVSAKPNWRGLLYPGG